MPVDDGPRLIAELLAEYTDPSRVVLELQARFDALSSIVDRALIMLEQVDVNDPSFRSSRAVHKAANSIKETRFILGEAFEQGLIRTHH